MHWSPFLHSAACSKHNLGPEGDFNIMDMWISIKRNVIISWLTYLYSGNPYTFASGLYFEMAPEFHYTNLMEIKFGSHPKSNRLIATNFSTCHSCHVTCKAPHMATVTFGKNCGDLVIKHRITLRWNFHQLELLVKNPSVQCPLTVM